MSKIVLTIEGEDWADVGLQLAAMHEAINRPTPAQPLAVVPPQATETAPAPVSAPQPVSGGVQIVDGVPGECAKHKRPLKSGKFGWFCSAQDETGPKGYCTLTPGDIYNGVRIVAAA